MVEILVTAGCGLITTVISGWTSWVFAKRKYNAEVDGNLISNMQQTLEFYEHLCNDNKTRLAEVIEEKKNLRKDLDKVSEENRKLKNDVDDLKSQMLKITTSICYDLSCQIRKKDYTTLNMNDKK